MRFPRMAFLFATDAHRSNTDGESRCRASALLAWIPVFFNPRMTRMTRIFQKAGFRVRICIRVNSRDSRADVALRK